MSAKVGVILSGCGVFDGTEITEAVSVLVALSKHGAQVTCLAPAIDQMHTIDHLHGRPCVDRRSVLVESARIARGKIKDIATAKPEEFDALIFPGGFGAAKNLSDFAMKGAECHVEVHVAKFARAVHDAGKPIGFACIAPVIAAKLFKGVVTIGNDPATATAIQSMGATHKECGPTDICIDEANRIVTTPCYMYDSTPWQVFQGADKLVDAVLKLVR